MTQVLLVALGVFGAVFALVLVGQLGKVLLERNPHSVWGERLTIVGIAARRSVRILAARYPVARAIADSLPDSDPPPPSRIPPGITMALFVTGGCVVVASLAGCSRADVIAGANVHHDVGHSTARILAEACDYEAAERLGGDLARERAAQLDAIYCEEAWLAQRAFAAAHRAQVRAIEAAEAGKCVIGAPRNEPACNLLQAAAATYQAGVALADAAAMVRAAARGAR